MGYCRCGIGLGRAGMEGHALLLRHGLCSIVPAIQGISAGARGAGSRLVVAIRYTVVDLNRAAGVES